MSIKTIWTYKQGQQDHSSSAHHGRHRPHIHIRSTLAGQQLPNLKSQEVTALYLPYKKNDIEITRGGSLVSPPPRSVRVNVKKK